MRVTYQEEYHRRFHVVSRNSLGLGLEDASISIVDFVFQNCIVIAKGFRPAPITAAIRNVWSLGTAGPLSPGVLYAVTMSQSAAKAARAKVIASSASKTCPLVSLISNRRTGPVTRHFAQFRP